MSRSTWIGATLPCQPADSIIDAAVLKVYFNGGIYNSSGRNLAPDGYNLGIKYQRRNSACKHRISTCSDRMLCSDGMTSQRSAPKTSQALPIHWQIASRSLAPRPKGSGQQTFGAVVGSSTSASILT